MVGLKPNFMGLFQFMGAKSKTPMRLENNSSQPSSGSELSLTGWWILQGVDYDFTLCLEYMQYKKVFTGQIE